MSKQLDIVIPCHNVSTTIETCLMALEREVASVVNDNLIQDVHLYLVDDGSRDNSLTLLSNRSYSVPHQILSQPQGGPSNARNHGTKGGSAPWILYVDSDVELKEGTLRRLLKALFEYPNLYAVNGYPTATIPHGRWITQYTNASLCFQLYNHGQLVNTAFTSLCLMQRDAWDSMNGWDTSRHSRYSDDIQSRWHFPLDSIQQCFEATFIHHKHVRIWGLLKHRFNLGYHYRNSIPSQRKNSNQKRQLIFLHLRYPSNVLLAGLSIAFFPLTLFAERPLIAILLFTWVSLLLLTNWNFFTFIRKQKDLVTEKATKLLDVTLSYLEGLSMGLGLFWSMITTVFSGTEHAS